MKEWFKFFAAIFGSLIIVSLIVSIIVFTVGCNTFKVIQVEGQPDECNDFYTVMMFYAEQSKGKGGGDSAFIGTVYNECKTAREGDRKMIKEKHCKALIFGDSPLDKRNYKLYSQFLECSK